MQYLAQPFSLASAHRVFYKVLVAHLRLHGMFIYPYQDDLLLKSTSWDQAEQDVSQTLDCLQTHSFMVNFTKSSLIPSQRIEHLSLLIDTQTALFSLSPECQQKLLSGLSLVLQTTAQDIITLAKLLGMLVLCQDIIPWVRFHSRHLQRMLLPFRHEIEHHVHRMVKLSPRVQEKLQWWHCPLRLSSGMDCKSPQVRGPLGGSSCSGTIIPKGKGPPHQHSKVQGNQASLAPLPGLHGENPSS